MARLLFLLLSFISLNIHTTLSSCIPDCGTDEYCSNYDFQCYQFFALTDYESVTIVKNGNDLSGNFDLVDLLDNNISTYLVMDKDGTGQQYALTLTFPSKYWLHYIDIDLSGSVAAITLTVDGNTTHLKSESTAEGWLISVDTVYLPISAQELVFEFWAFGSGTYNMFSVDIFGASGTPQPTESPTMEPTPQTEDPTSAPTDAPTDLPSKAPTKYPTPDVCEELMVKQDCCGGNYGYLIDDDKTNIRDPSLETCEQKQIGGCCGDGNLDGQFYRTEIPYWGCDDQLDNVWCNAPFYNNSRYTGYVIDSQLVAWPINNSSIADLDLYSYCKCEYTLYECTGTDNAVCGTMGEHDKLFEEDCWGNDTRMDYEKLNDEDCFLNVTANGENEQYQHLAYEACSEESFFGSVSAILSITSEYIHEDDCSCNYYIKDCKLLTSNKYNDPALCRNEIIDGCCGDSQNVTDNVYATEFDEYNYPTNWTCNDSKQPLCPDKWNGTVFYDTEYRVDWWYDRETDKTNKRCGCRYFEDICEFPPTYEPSMAPVASPTNYPTEGPTKKPIVDSGEGDFASHIRLSYMVMVILSIIFVMVF